MNDCDGEVCTLDQHPAASHKLPNSLIDVCLIYGVDEKTSGSLSRLLDPTSDSTSKGLHEKLHQLEVEPYCLAIINALHTHFPHLSSGGLDDSYVSIDTAVDEKELEVSWDVVKTLQKFFFPEGAVIEVTNEPSPASTMSIVLTDINGLRTYCTGLCFYRPFTIIENGSEYRLEPCSRKSYPSDARFVYIPTCAVFISSSPCYNIQKELLSCLLYKLTQVDDLMFWDVLKKFVQKLFLLPLPPPGIICIEFSLDDYAGRICPPMSGFVNLDIRLNYPFLSLSVDHVLQVVGALLLEQRIVFISTSYTLLTYNTECFLGYIAPLEWRSTYVPVLPSEMLALLDAPGSYIYGCHTACLTADVTSSVEELVVVDLDKDDIRMINYPESSIPKIPNEVCESFKQSYYQLKRSYELEEADHPMRVPAIQTLQHRREYEHRYDICLLELFLNLMVDLFGELTNYLCSGHLRYEESSTYKSANKDTKEFYKIALQTDLFSLLLQNRNTKTTRDSFTLLSDKKRRDKRATVSCALTEEESTPKPVKQKSEDLSIPKSRSLFSRNHSHQPTTTSFTGSIESLTVSKTSSLGKLSLEQPRSLLESDTLNDNLCGCDPSSYYTLKLPSLQDEVLPHKFYNALCDTLTDVIKESTASTDKLAPALYLRACGLIAAGKFHDGFADFATLDKHSVQLMPSQRMLGVILAPLSKEVAEKLKTQDFWPLFTRRLKGYSRQPSYRVTDLRNKLPTKPLPNDLFLKTVQKNNIVADSDSANRLYRLLADTKPAVLPSDFETFYEAWKSLIDDNFNTELPTESLAKSIMDFKHAEKVLATLTSHQLKTTHGSGHVILTTCRVLVQNSLKVYTICDLTNDTKVEKQENLGVLGQGQPMITFVLKNFKDNAGSMQQSYRQVNTFHRSTKKMRYPYIVFQDKTTREIWLKMIREMQMGLLLAKTKRDPQIIRQAESNIILLGALLNSNLSCKAIVRKAPYRVLHLATTDSNDKSDDKFRVTAEESLLYRINPSANQVTKATIECSLYVPPDRDSLLCGCGAGKLWLGLGTGLLRVYDSVQYFLESDTKISDTSQKTGARLSSFLLVDNFVWAGSLNRTIYILDSDTSTVVSKLSNLEDDPSVLASGKLDHQKVVWSLLIKGIVIAWNPLTRERVLTAQISVSSPPKNHQMICYAMAVLGDHLWIGTNLDMIVVLKMDNSNKWSVAKEVRMDTGKVENQIKCVTVSNRGLIWCSTKAPTTLKVFDASTFEVKYKCSNLRENKPVNVLLPVKDQVWCGTKDGKILIFEDKDEKSEEPFTPLKTVSAHEDTIRTMLLTENGYVVSGSGSRDGSAAIWNPSLVNYKT